MLAVPCQKSVIIIYRGDKVEATASFFVTMISEMIPFDTMSNDHQTARGKNYCSTIHNQQCVGKFRAIYECVMTAYKSGSTFYTTVSYLFRINIRVYLNLKFQRAVYVFRSFIYYCFLQPYLFNINLQRSTADSLAINYSVLWKNYL